MIQWTCIQMEGFDFMYETFFFIKTQSIIPVPFITVLYNHLDIHGVYVYQY